MTSMGTSYAKKASITLPTPLETALKKLAHKEHRTLSGILQEAARYYLNIRQWENLQKRVSVRVMALGIRSEDDVNDLVHRSR